MARKYLGGSGESLTICLSLAASTVLVFYGYDQGVFGNILVSEDFLRVMGHPSTSMQGLMTSVYNLGCFVGAMSTIWTGDYLGRPRTIIAGSTIIAIGAVIQTASYSVTQMMIGRVVAGLGTGMNTATAGVWQAETSKMRSRGKLVVIQMANCIFGFSISNWLTLGLSFVPGSISWRLPLAFQIVFTLIIYCLCPFLPDSPRLLIRKGKYDEAFSVLAALEGDGATEASPSVRSQFAIIQEVLQKENANTYTFFQLITGRGPSGALRRMLLGAWMQISNQISGINVTSYYQTYILIHALNFSPLKARILAAAGSVDYLIFSCLAYFVIERYGRRRVMMCSAAACSICWIVITVAQNLSLNNHGDSHKLGALAVAAFFFFWASFAMGVLNVPWLYPTEIGHINLRAQTASLAMASNWMSNFIVVQVTPAGLDTLTWRFWIIWAVICAAFVPITYFFYPETANRSLEDIDRFFAEKPGYFVHRNRLATQLKRPELFVEADARVVEKEQRHPSLPAEGNKGHEVQLTVYGVGSR
ncbi:MAG: hypothetical protein M1814_002552 [Vezdaea aestivalis]|nr:MAG: hypothetical protein M1814_002552 [Vezdaea aestivalis]